MNVVNFVRVGWENVGGDKLEGKKKGEREEKRAEKQTSSELAQIIEF